MRIRLVESPLAIPKYRQVRLPTVAAELAPYADVEINDENVEPFDYSQVDLVGFSAQVYNVKRAVHHAKLLRDQGVKTILGGPHATAMPKWALQHFDAVVAGEVEGLGERIVSDLEHGRLGGIYRNEQPPDLSQVGLPRRDLQKAELYYRFNYPIELSRGCTYSCSFCFAKYQYPEFRVRPLERIAADLEQWDHGMLEVVDLHMAANRDHLIAACKLFEQVGVPGWFGEATLGSLDDDELLEGMARSNCKMVFLGLESINAKSLKSVAKGFNPHKNYAELIKKIQDYGIFVHAGLIWGLDGEDEDTYAATLEFCRKTKLYLASSNLLNFYPGTRGYARIEEEGRLLTDDFRQFDSAHVVVEPTTLTREAVVERAGWFVRRFYSLVSIFRRSFQNPNYRLSQLVDYWAFNLLYRAYYRKWSRRLDAAKPPPELGKNADAEGFPLFGGHTPALYSVLDRSWRFFERWYRWWEAPPAATSPLATAGLLAVSTAGAVGGGLAVRSLAAARWPVAWPPTWAVLVGFLLAAIYSFALVHRLASSRIRGPAAALGLLASISPMVAVVSSLPESSVAWRLGLSGYTALFVLKAWSLVYDGSFDKKGFLRSYAFIFFFPNFDFSASFEPSHRRKNLMVHSRLMASGFGQTLVGLAMLVALTYALILRLDESGIFAQLGLAFALGVAAQLAWCGTFDFLAGYWRMAGYVTTRGWKRPRGGFGPAALWRCVNLPIQRWFLSHVYLPLGGNRRPWLAVPLTFLFGTALVELVVVLATGSLSPPIAMFFAAHAVAVLIDKLALERFCSRYLVGRFFSALVTLSLLLATLPLLAADAGRFI